MLLEGGERRPHEDTFWYPDLQRMVKAGKYIEPYLAPPEAPGVAAQCIHLDHIEPWQFRHDVEPRARRTMRTLSESTGLLRQVVHEAHVAAGDLTTAFHTHERTDEWLLILDGTAQARVGAEKFEVGPGDFLGHAAGSLPHVLEATTDLTYLVGGQRDAADVVIYPEAGLRRVRGALHRTMKP